MDDLKQMVAITALNNMMAKGWFDVCTIDKVAQMLGVDPKGEAYRTLAPLHCVNFSEMPHDLKTAIPGLIRGCLGVEPIYRFELPKPVTTTASQPLEPARRGLMRLLTRS